MLKNAKPSDYFVGAILRSFHRARAHRAPVTCSAIWDYVCRECILGPPGAFRTMFEWDESKAKRINRIHTIAETIRRGLAPDLTLAKDERGRETVVMSTESGKLLTGRAET